MSSISHPSPGSFSPQATEAIIRRFAHDLRNQLNAQEIEIAQLGFLAPAAEVQTSLARLRKHMGSIENSLKSLALRFVEPEKKAVPVVDLYTLWSTRAMRLLPDSSAKWINQATSEMIFTDMRMLGDALGEMLTSYKVSPSEVNISASPQEIGFRCRWIFPDADGEIQRASQLPGQEEFIARLGGEYCGEHGSGQAEISYVFPVYLERN
ncbi:hypothetical protein ACFSSA_03875 [Luteolibacter algae]|uniref:Histidine kinase n=1 Tax=Luteolibacter algae TaxID=454151 RepID=A0ABW5D518_9BACT